MASDELHDNQVLIQNMVSRGFSYAYIAGELREKVGNSRGISERSVRRFCANKGIKRKGTVSDDTLSVAITKAVDQVWAIVDR